MGMSRMGKWEPVFPGEAPPVWVAFVSRPGGRLDMASSHMLQPKTQRWLADWLKHYVPAQPEASASYVYLALGSPNPPGKPNGMKAASGVRGVGSGQDYGEPPGAQLSTVAAIVKGAIELLQGKTSG